MADDIKIRVANFNDLLSRIDKLPADLQEEVHFEFADAVMRISAKQKRLAPKDFGGIAQTTGFFEERTNSTDKFVLFSNSEYAGYMEFGTRKKVVVPAGLEEIALQFKGPGITSTLTARQAIYAWGERHGFPKESLSLLFLIIMIRGVNPHPFFFAPFYEETKGLIKNVERILESHKL